MNKLKKVGILVFIWNVCWLLGNLTSHVLAQEAPFAEQNYAAGYATAEEQDWRESAFYRTIVDNNIFRPLGWTPPKPMPMYHLLGTVISIDGISVQAILQEIGSERLHFVTVGDKVGDATVGEILSKQVTLDKTDQTITLKLGTLQLLSLSRMQDRGAGRYRSNAEIGQSLTYKYSTDSIYQIQSVSKEKRRNLIQQYRRR